MLVIRDYRVAIFHLDPSFLRYFVRTDSGEGVVNRVLSPHTSEEWDYSGVQNIAMKEELPKTIGEMH